MEENMRISIITVPHVKNYGAILLCYAMRTLFESNGFDVEFVNFYRKKPEEADSIVGFYRQAELLGKKSMLYKIAATCMQLSSIRGRARTFNTFVNKYLNLSMDYGDNEELLYNTPPTADVYCTGGDQMWNEMYNFHRTIKPFYLDFAPVGIPRVSFSTSIGKTGFDEWEIPEVVPLLQKYSLISVRERSGKHALEDLGFANVFHIQDPTLLLDNVFWGNLAAPRKYDMPYMLVYQIGNRTRVRKSVRALAKKMNWKIIWIAQNNFQKYSSVGKVEFLPSPEEFLSLIKYARCIVTNSFHGTAFSINFNRPFISILPQNTGTRIESLLECCNLKERAYREGSMLDICEKSIDFTATNSILARERVKAQDYICEIKKLCKQQTEPAKESVVE